MLLDPCCDSTAPPLPWQLIKCSFGLEPIYLHIRCVKAPKPNSRYATWDSRFHPLAAFQSRSARPCCPTSTYTRVSSTTGLLNSIQDNLKGSVKTERTTNRNELVSLRPEQSGASALTWFRVGVSVSFGATVGRCLLVVLLLGEGKGKGLAGTRRAARLRVSKPAVAAALLGSVWEMERHAPLGLKHPQPPESQQ